MRSWVKCVKCGDLMRFATRCICNLCYSGGHFCTGKIDHKAGLDKDPSGSHGSWDNTVKTYEQQDKRVT